MAIQYYMRAFNTTLSQYVDWVVNDAPDSTGQFSGYPINQLIDITVNRVVQSKVHNFLKQNQSLGGTDGYYFHVNSYDWKNATAPIGTPSNLTGWAVERGIVSVTPVSSATNASPIVVVSSSPHGLATGQIVTITGAQGNVAANGTWPVIVTSPTQFSLVGSSGTGAYTGGGNIFTPRDFSTLTWDENAAGFPNGVWRFVLNTNGDGVTLGLHQDVKMNSAFLDGYLQLGPDPADSGVIRLSNNTFINSESNPSGTDIQLIGADNLNRIKIGNVVGDITYMPGVLVVDGYVAHDGTGNNVAQTGFIRAQNNETIAAFRAQSLLSDIIALSSNTSNNVIIGDAANAGTIHNTATNNTHLFQVNTLPNFEIGTAFARFTQAVVSPTINQVTAGVGISGQTLTVQAQNAGAGSTNGGILSLTSGTGGSFNGTVDISTGGTLKMRVFPTVANSASDNNSILFFENKLRFDSAQTAPTILQDTTSGATPGQPLTVQAQNSTLAGSTGGALNLTSGTGITTSGRVNVQTGGTTQIIVSPTFIAPGTSSGQQTNGSIIILGNLEVVGTTTTIDSTVVDIIGRVIHANWADPAASPNVAVPSQIVGYSIHRGNASSFARDGAAIIWTEGAQANGSDGYWRAVTIPGDGYGTDNFTIANSTNNVGVQANNFVPTPDPNPVAGTLPATGGIRSPNNLPVTVARNVTPTTTITGGPGATLSNLAVLPQATINVVSTTGFTSAGTLLVFSSAGPQTITYTGTTGTTFTGCVGGTGTLFVNNYVAQTNRSTTIAAGSNGIALPQATINVASAVGFPTSGTIRVVTSVSNSNGNTLSVQTVTYSGTTGTSFTGCTGGIGTMFTGNAVSSLPIAGSADLALVGTDFGNRVLWGSPTALTGHIFNTPTNTLFDFQVNSVPQIRIQANDTNSDGYVEVLEIEPTVVSPRVAQLVRPDFGANAGFQLTLQAQNGQNQEGANPNNNGGNLVLASGAAGTGGNAPAVHGNVVVQTDGELKMTIFPTFAASAANSNTMLIEESIIRIGPTQNVPRIRQDSTTNATGHAFTLQAQNAATRGGPLLLQSGTGPGSLDGYIDLVTGTTTKVTVFPTFAINAADHNSILLFENKVRFDLAQTVPLIRQDDQTAASTNGQSLTLQAQNATGATSNGGPLLLKSGTGTQFDGYTDILTGNSLKARFYPTFSTTASDNNTMLFFENIFRFDTSLNVPRIRQDSTGSASGQSLSLQAQNAATTGGPLLLQSGTGATNDGYINLITGSTTKMTIFPTTAVSAADNNSILFFENLFRIDTAQVTPRIRQDDTVGATGANLTIQSQNAATTGGNLVLTSGTGATTAGNVHIQTGAVDKVIVHPTFTEFRDTAEALRITPVSAGTTQVTFASTVTAATVNHTTTGAATGATMTVQAQDAATTGGNLVLGAGNGATTAGNVLLQNGGTTTASTVPNKFVLNRGWRRHVTSITSAAPYTVLADDDYIAITTLAAPFQIDLPATPTVGDTFTIKDATGNAAISNVTVSGGANNIDGAGSFLMSQPYAAATFTFLNGQWSVT